MTERALIWPVAALLVALVAPTALAAQEGWQGVWIDARYECLTEEGVKELSLASIEQGPHWQIFEGSYCEALRGDGFEDRDTWTVTGLCRGFGSLASETWRFELKANGEAVAKRETTGAVTLKRCVYEGGLGR